MPLKVKVVILGFLLAGSAGHAAEIEEMSPVVTANPAAYDEVGYATIGEVSDGRQIAIAHATLPLASFAEVTNLDTGRTILVVVNDRGQRNPGRIAVLSSAAAKQLGIETQSPFPVRIRRTNPPEYERSAVRNGTGAGERIETPPALLGALRKMLSNKPTMTSDNRGVAKSAKAGPARLPAKLPRGATYAAPPAAANVDDDRFVEEDISSASPSASAETPRSVTRSPPRGSYYIQLAAFSSEARARAVALKTGGSVQAAGTVWRVRKGPYESASSARSALGPVRANGYRDARVTR